MQILCKNAVISTLLVGSLIVPTTAIANEYTKETSIQMIASTQFSDVKVDHYAYQAILWAQNKSIVSGYGDGRFGPNDDVTEAQFAKMITNYYKLKDTYGDINKTTKQTHWSDDSYDALAQYAVPLNGYFDNKIRNKPIKRGLVAQVLTYVAGYRTDLTGSIEFLLDKNITAGQYPQYKDTDLKKFFGSSINLTRSQIVAFLYRMENEGLTSMSESIDHPNGKTLNEIATTGKERVDSNLSQGSIPKVVSTWHTDVDTTEPEKPTYKETELPIKPVPSAFSGTISISDEAHIKFFEMLSDATISSLKSKDYSIVLSEVYKGGLSISLRDERSNGFGYSEEATGTHQFVTFPSGEEKLGSQFINDLLGTNFSSSDFLNIDMTNGKYLSKNVFVQHGFGGGYIIHTIR